MEEVVGTGKSFGIQPKRTSFRSPWQNRSFGRRREPGSSVGASQFASHGCGPTASKRCKLWKKNGAHETRRRVVTKLAAQPGEAHFDASIRLSAPTVPFRRGQRQKNFSTARGAGLNGNHRETDFGERAGTMEKGCQRSTPFLTAT
jgi:hypothetical protein